MKHLIILHKPNYNQQLHFKGTSSSLTFKIHNETNALRKFKSNYKPITGLEISLSQSIVNNMHNSIKQHQTKTALSKAQFNHCQMELKDKQNFFSCKKKDKEKLINCLALVTPTNLNGIPMKTFTKVLT